MRGDAPRVSVVTPVHNTAAYLSACIESVLGQSFGDFEYVIVDNASTDGSREISESYARTDSRIRLHRTKALLPQVPNYNAALKLIHPSTAYTKIVQADDKLFPRCLEEMLQLAVAHPDIGIVSAYMLHGPAVRCQGLPPDRQVFSRDEVCTLHLMTRRSVFGSPTAVMYRSDLVRDRDRFYDEVSLLEDTRVCYDLLRQSRFGFVHQVLTYARADNPSLTDSFIGFNPYLLHELILLRLYGTEILGPQRASERWDELWGMYRTYLGQAALEGVPPAFWEYHRAGWREMNLRVSPWEIRRARIKALAKLLGSPRDLALRLRSRLRRP